MDNENDAKNDNYIIDTMLMSIKDKYSNKLLMKNQPASIIIAATENDGILSTTDDMSKIMTTVEAVVEGLLLNQVFNDSGCKDKTEFLLDQKNKIIMKFVLEELLTTLTENIYRHLDEVFMEKGLEEKGFYADFEAILEDKRKRMIKQMRKQTREQMSEELPDILRNIAESIENGTFDNEQFGISFGQMNENGEIEDLFDDDDDNEDNDEEEEEN